MLPARGALATWTEVTAAASHEDAANSCSTAEATFPFAPVGTVAKLKLAGEPPGVHEVRNGRATEADGIAQNPPNGTVQQGDLSRGERGGVAGRMDASAPQAFVGINVAETPKDTLVEEKRLDHCPAPGEALPEVGQGGFQGVEAELTENTAQRVFGQQSQTAEAARVCVAKLPAIIQGKASMSVGTKRFSSRAETQIAGHAEMHQQRVPLTAVRLQPVCFCGGHKAQKHKLAIAFNGFNALAGEMALEDRRVVHEVGLPQADGDDPAARQDGAEAAHNGFDLG